MYRWTRVPAGSHREIHPSTRRMRNSRRRDVAKPPSLVPEFTCCYATSSPYPTNVCARLRQRRRVSTAPLSTAAGVADRGRNRRHRDQQCVIVSTSFISASLKTFHIFRSLNFFYLLKENRSNCPFKNRLELKIRLIGAIFPTAMWYRVSHSWKNKMHYRE